MHLFASRNILQSIQKYALTSILFITLSITNLHAQDTPSVWVDSITSATAADLEDLSLEELMNITITSVSKKPQVLSNAAAAIFVITQEDIKRSGARVLPEVFRMVPGLHVAKIDGNKWAVTSRGFNGRVSNKLLVLQDGRTLYNTLFSGVFWEAHDIPLNDIERIEVIRGPGATLYGSNALNGVINIITKHAKDTQGTVITIGSGSEEQGNGYVRQGGNIGDEAHYRFYAKYSDRDSQALSDGSDANDSWNSFRSGYRIDATLSEQDTLTVTSDVYLGENNSRFPSYTATPPYTLETQDRSNIWGTNLVARWDHSISETESLMLQFFYDHNNRDSYMFDLNEDILDLDFQHRFQPIDRHDLLWGLGYRFVTDELHETPQLSYDIYERDNHIFNAFIQDEIELLEDRLSLILGSKFEHNEFSGFEYQPNARLLWTPHEQHVLWASVSRAVRTPSRLELNGYGKVNVLPPNNSLFPFPVPVLVTVSGQENVQSEDLLAYELGYRFLPADWVYLDATLFYHDYDNVLNAEPSDVTSNSLQGIPILEVPILFNNKMQGESYGFELAADIQANEKWKIRQAFTVFDMQMHPESFPNIRVLEEVENRNPNFQFSILSTYDFNDHVEFDVWARYVSEIGDTFSIQQQNALVDDYLSLDIRVGWKPNNNVEVVLGFQNILDDHHPENGETMISPFRSEVERSFYLTTTWKF